MVLENPLDEEEDQDDQNVVTIWDLDLVQNFLDKIHAKVVALRQSPWGAPSPKPTKLAGTLAGLEEFGYNPNIKDLTDNIEATLSL